MKRTRPDWVNDQLFPFSSKWITIDGHDMHYIDEGSGDVILFAHGTPEWSFGYRDLIKELSKNYRCIAADMLGFGLSEKPTNADYSCQAHAARLEQFIESLKLKNITIVANDFGGGISMNYAIKNPDNINRIVLFNTWMWSLKEDKHYAGPARMMNSWLGKWLYLKLNFPVNVIMPSSFGDKSKLTPQIHAHYKRALPSRSRQAAYQFSKELMKASEWWQQLWNNLPRLQDKPFLFFWGQRDKFVPIKELNKWRSKLPDAHVRIFEDAGHFVQEEKPAEMATEISRFLHAEIEAPIRNPK